MPSTLPHYWQLSSAQQNDRLSSSRLLIHSLVSEQAAAKLSPVAAAANPLLFEDGLHLNVAQVDANVVAEAESFLDANSCGEVGYAVRRLIKGLASHRESSRVGFATALSELLGRLHSTPTKDIVTLVLSYSTPAGKVKGQEERDLLFARLFGLLAVIRSGILTDENLTQGPDFKRIVQIAWLLGKSKSWLRESAAWTIVEAVKVVASSAQVSWKNECLQWLIEKVCSAAEVTPEAVAIFLSVRRADPDLPLSASLPLFSGADLLASANLASLARTLKQGLGSEDVDEEAARDGGSAKVHFVWDLLLGEYTAGSKHAKRAPLQEMFRVLVDEALFNSNASDRKKCWGFQVFEKAIHGVSTEDVQAVFTPNFLRTLTNQLSNKSNRLYKNALDCVAAIQEATKDNLALGLAVLRQLNKKDGAPFDAITGTKSIEGILASVKSSDAVHEYVHSLFASAYHLSKHNPESSRRWPIDLLLSIVRNRHVDIGEEAEISILTFLIAHGFFAVNAPYPLTESGATWAVSLLPEPTFSDSIKAVCRERFYSCLAELCDRMTFSEGENGKIIKKQGQTASGQMWMSRASQIFEDLAQDSKHFIPLYETNKKTEVVSQITTFRKKLSKAGARAEKVSDMAKTRQFETLLLAGILYSRKDLQWSEDLERDLIGATIECGNRLVLGQKAQVDEPSSMELFIHCITSFLEHPSVFLRNATNQAFAAFVDELDQKSLEQLLHQLGFQGQDEEAGEEEEGDEDIDDDDDDMVDEEIMSDSISETSATSISSTRDDDNVDPVLVSRLHEVLKAAGAADSDEELSEGEDDALTSSVDVASDLDDDQMLLIDDKLADIFRQRLGSRREEQKAKQETVALHIKILDLLDIFARKESNSALCVEMVLPLFTIALEQDAALKQLKQRASVVLQSLCKSKDGPSGSVGFEQVMKPLEAIHSMAATKVGAPNWKLCSDANVFLVKTCGQAAQVHGPVAQLHLTSIDDFLERKNNNVKANFFCDTFGRVPLLGFSLRSELLARATRPQNTAKDSYRQLQALEMLRTALIGLGGDESHQDVLVTFLPQVSSALLRIVCTEKLRLKEIIHIGLDLAKLSKRVCPDGAALESIWPASLIHEAMDALERSNKVSNSVSLRSLLRQLAIVVGCEDVRKKASASKRTEADGVEPVEKQTSARKKQRKH